MSITYEFHVDWDSADWAATPDFSEGIDDITSYVKKYYVDRGKKVELGNTPAGTVDLILDNSDKRFSPPYSSSPLFGKMRPWLPVRLRATVTSGGAKVFWTGFISRIAVNPHVNVQEAYLYCTDGLDFLARSMVTVNKTNRELMKDGEAIGLLLNSAGWPALRRSIDVDTGAILNYPTVSEI